MKKNTIESISTEDLEKILAERKAEALEKARAKNARLIEAAQEAALANMPFQMTGNPLPFTPVDFLYPDVVVTMTGTTRTRSGSKVIKDKAGKQYTVTGMRNACEVLGIELVKGNADPRTALKNYYGDADTMLTMTGFQYGSH